MKGSSGAVQRERGGAALKAPGVTDNGRATKRLPTREEPLAS